VTGGWRKLHNEELYSLYYHPSIIRTIKSRRMRWDNACSMQGKEEYKNNFGGKARRKGTLGSPRRKM
jgi:hypothetical protein